MTQLLEQNSAGKSLNFNLKSGKRGQKMSIFISKHEAFKNNTCASPQDKLIPNKFSYLTKNSRVASRYVKAQLKFTHSYSKLQTLKFHLCSVYIKFKFNIHPVFWNFPAKTTLRFFEQICRNLLHNLKNFANKFNNSTGFFNLEIFRTLTFLKYFQIV